MFPPFLFSTCPCDVGCDDRTFLSTVSSSTWPSNQVICILNWNCNLISGNVLSIGSNWLWEQGSTQLKTSKLKVPRVKKSSRQSRRTSAGSQLDTKLELETNLCEIKSFTIKEKDPRGLLSDCETSIFAICKGSFRVSSTRSKWINQMCWNFCRVEIYYQTLNIQTITQSAQYNVSTLLWRSVDECTWHVFSSKDWWELAVGLWVCT